ncbi:MAG: thioredoxin family protein [Spirulina sp. SIO3F2]|nr:thioredoxin family protein [Spirulina sp. SIO3F2]
MTPASLAVRSVETDELEQLITTEPLLVVDYTATWCDPCRVIAPAIERLATEFENHLVVVTVDLDQNKASASHHNIRSLPTVLIFKRGKEVARIIGKAAYETFRNTLDQHL